MIRWIHIGCVVACLSIASLVLASSAVVVPGLQVPTLTQSLLGPNDLRSLRLAIDLDAAQLRAVHAVLQDHQAKMQALRVNLQEAIGAAAPEGAAAIQARQATFDAEASQIREQIEQRRRAGEFDGRPEAMKEALEEAMLESQRDMDAGAAQLAQLEGWADAFQDQVDALLEFRQQARVAEGQTQATLKSMLGEAEAAAFDRWWADRILAREMRLGRLSGEAVDVVRIWEQQGKPETDDVRAQVDQWRQSHLELVQARRDALWELPQAIVKSIRQGRLGSADRATDVMMQTRAEVRESHVQLANALATTLPPEDQAAWMEAVYRRMYPSVWRPDRATRALSAALQRSDLEPAQRAAIRQLMDEHDAWRETLRQEHVQAINDDEPQQLGYRDLMLVQAYLPGTVPARPERTEMMSLKRAQDRAALDIMLTLRGLLTESQWEAIPGTASDYVRD